LQVERKLNSAEKNIKMQLMLQIFTTTAVTKLHEHKLRVQIEIESAFLL